MNPFLRMALCAAVLLAGAACSSSAQPRRTDGGARPADAGQQLGGLLRFDATPGPGGLTMRISAVIADASAAPDAGGACPGSACCLLPLPQTPSPAPVSAGAIQYSTDLTAGSLAFDGGYLPRFGANLWSPLATLHFDAPGDIAARFAGDITAAGELSVASTASDAGLAIDRTQSFDLEWTGTSADEVVITLEGNGDGGGGLLCAFPDTGTAILPASLLGQLPPGGGSLSIERRRLVQTSGANIQVQVLSSFTQEVTGVAIR